MIDFENRMLRLPKTKNGKSHNVPLSEAVLQILNGLPTRRGAGALLFPGRNPSTPIKGIQKAWVRICQRAGVSGMRVHDLRHSLASFMVAAGYSLPMIGAILNHSNTQTTSRYAHLADKPQREALETTFTKIAGG